jgi:hypothetical protein
MGFIADPGAVERCLEFIEGASPFRYCFLAVGSPQQEVLARLLGARVRAPHRISAPLPGPWPATAGSALTLLAGGVAVLRCRRKK